MTFLQEYEKHFNNVCKTLAKIVSEAIDKTESDLGCKMDDDMKKLCVGFAIIHLLHKCGDK